MLRFLLVCGIIAAVYFCAVGFLRTASRMGWSEAGEAKPIAVNPRR